MDLISTVPLTFTDLDFVERLVFVRLRSLVDIDHCLRLEADILRSLKCKDYNTLIAFSRIQDLKTGSRFLVALLPLAYTKRIQSTLGKDLWSS